MSNYIIINKGGIAKILDSEEVLTFEAGILV